MMESNRRQITFERLVLDDGDGILAMSRLATDILREHYNPILGKAQNDYMLEKFQSADAIGHQLESGYQYYLVRADERNIGSGYFMDDYVYALNVDDWQSPASGREVPQ